MKFSEFLNEANSKAAAEEIEYIDIDYNEDDEECAIVFAFTDRNIKEHRAEYFVNGMFDIPSDANYDFNNGKLVVSVEGDGEDFAKDVKRVAKENDIHVE